MINLFFFIKTKMENIIYIYHKIVYYYTLLF